MTAFGQYADDDSGSTLKSRDHKDATDLVVTATSPVTHALTVSDGATEDGTGRGTPIVPAIAFHPRQDPIHSVEVTHAMGTGSRQGTATVAVAQPTMAVRRLLPVKTERLQGFPDGWTDIPWRGKPAPDGPRYKAMGNSMAVPVMRWIGERLDKEAKCRSS